jgi:multidrug efflux pump
LVNRVVKPRLQTVTGVADVRIFGERKYAMLVSLDHARLSSYKLTPQDVEDAIRRNNLELPAGRIESQTREFSVSSQTDLNRPGQFGEIVIRSVNGFPVKLRDVAQIKEDAANDRSAVRLNGRPAISAGVIRQATANPLELSAGVREMIPRLKADLPGDMAIEVANDNSVFIDRSIKNVFTTIVEAVVLVALVIFVFLRTIRASIIPIITIPVSLIGAFTLALVNYTTTELIGKAPALSMALYGLLLIVMVTFLPNGLIGGLASLAARLGLRQRSSKDE